MNLKAKKIKAVDLFCGAGGASTALRRALHARGLRSELLAVNHWPTAVETHTLNHPDVRHLCQSIENVDPRVEVPSGRLHLLIAAPECTHHSTARGGRPINDQSRASAWHILKWEQELYIDNLLIENVPEFMEWGPLGANGRPLKSRKGETFRAFVEALRSLGNTVEYRVLNAADYGDPTTRRRLFIIARRGNRPIRWPMPTHTKDGRRTLLGPTKKWRAAREVIDWTIQSRSIFDPTRRPLSPKTVARIMAGLRKFGGRQLEPFLIAMEHGQRERSIDAPLPTITTAKGGAFAVVEPFVLQQQSGGVPRTVGEPLPTIATDGAQMLIEPFVITPGGADLKGCRQVSSPLPTVTCSDRFAVVEPFLVPYYTERVEEKNARARSVDEPLPTITTAGGGKVAVVEPFIVEYHSERPGSPARVRSLDEPVPTQTTENRFGVVEPFLIPHYGEREGQLPRVHSVDEPVPTIPASGHGKFEVVEPIIASYYGTQNTSPVSAPLPTVTTKDRFALVQPVVNGARLDIRLRMLKPKELARAMSFGDDYQFAGNKTEQVKQIGNAWPCQLGEALLGVLLDDYAAAKPRETGEAVA